MSRQLPSGHSFSSFYQGATLFRVQLVNTITGMG